MTWTVCDLRGVKTIKKNGLNISIVFYLESTHKGILPYGKASAYADGIITIGKKSLVCEIKRLEENPQSWFTPYKDKSKIYRDAKLNRQRKFWEGVKKKKFSKKRVKTACCAMCFKLKLQNPYAWPIVIGGQLERTFLEFEDIQPKKGGYIEKIKKGELKRCLIFDERCKNDIEKAFKLLFYEKNINKVPGLVRYTIPKAGLDDVHIWEFGEPRKNKKGKPVNSIGKVINMKGWYTR